jgi:hypothetical protein
MVRPVDNTSEPRVSPATTSVQMELFLYEN